MTTANQVREELKVDPVARFALQRGIAGLRYLARDLVPRLDDATEEAVTSAVRRYRDRNPDLGGIRKRAMQQLEQVALRRKEDRLVLISAEPPWVTTHVAFWLTGVLASDYVEEIQVTSQRATLVSSEIRPISNRIGSVLL